MENEMITQKLERCKDLPPGPWRDEPDKANWKDEKTNLDCMIVRNHQGSLCGYVGVPLDSKLAGKNYQELEEKIDVHGGLTYSKKCNGDICHIAKEEVYWFGFDCAHAFDLSPEMHKFYPEYESKEWKDEYRDFNYVKEQVESLAQQIKELMK